MRCVRPPPRNVPAFKWVIALTRRAIRSWRHLAGLANPGEGVPNAG
jgi:hypothetical protein